MVRVLNSKTYECDVSKFLKTFSTLFNRDRMDEITQAIRIGFECCLKGGRMSQHQDVIAIESLTTEWIAFGKHLHLSTHHLVRLSQVEVTNER